MHVISGKAMLYLDIPTKRKRSALKYFATNQISFCSSVDSRLWVFLPKVKWNRKFCSTLKYIELKCHSLIAVRARSKQRERSTNALTVLLPRWFGGLWLVNIFCCSQSEWLKLENYKYTLKFLYRVRHWSTSKSLFSVMIKRLFQKTDSIFQFRNRLWHFFVAKTREIYNSAIN